MWFWERSILSSGWRNNGNSEEDRETQKLQIVEESMKLNWKFVSCGKGGRGNQINLYREGYGYFLEQHNMSVSD